MARQIQNGELKVRVDKEKTGFFTVTVWRMTAGSLVRDERSFLGKEQAKRAFYEILTEMLSEAPRTPDEEAQYQSLLAQGF